MRWNDITTELNNHFEGGVLSGDPTLRASMADLKLRRLNELNSRDFGSECRSDRFLEVMRLEVLRFFLLILIMVHSAIKKKCFKRCS